MKKGDGKMEKAIKKITKNVNGLLKNRKGQGALDIAIQCLIAIVLGALTLGGLYLIINGTVLPTITSKIASMFNYAG